MSLVSQMRLSSKRTDAPRWHGASETTRWPQEAMVNEPVLVLNANYEPLNICTTKRAVGMMLSGN
jgi:hypothetical protein